MEIAGLNTDLQQEYARQREHLERSLATLKKKVVKEGELHRTDYVRIMQVPRAALCLAEPSAQAPICASAHREASSLPWCFFLLLASESPDLQTVTVAKSHPPTNEVSF